MKKVLCVFLFPFTLMINSCVFATYDEGVDRYTLLQRIKPMGEVKIASEEKATLANHTVSTQHSGEKIYMTYCAVCHANGVAGAPKFRDVASWGERANKEKTLLLQSATAGMNAMPAKGNCLDCDQEKLMGAIEYMLPKN